MSWARCIRRFSASCDPHWYPAGLEWGLHVRREGLIDAVLEQERAGS